MYPDSFRQSHRKLATRVRFQETEMSTQDQSAGTWTETDKNRIESIILDRSQIDLTFQSHFIGKLFETCHFVSDPLTADQLDERIRDDIQGREKAKDSTGSRQFRCKSYPKIVPRLSLSIELNIYVGSCLNYGIKRLEKRKITTHSLIKPRFV